MSLLAATVQSTGGPTGGGGGPYTFADTVSSTLSSYDVATEATADGWNGTKILNATITIAAGVTGPFTTGTLPASSTVALTVQNTGFIRGNGGEGGDGGDPSPGTDGSAGGTAISFSANGSITIDSGGEVSGGGGGGGGGGGYFVDPNEIYGGGGGGGFPNGAGGNGGVTAPDGADGTSGGGGAGGAGGSIAGGDGGGAATAGNAGTSSTFAGGAGGAAGSAIEKNGYTVTVTNNGTLNGVVND